MAMASVLPSVAALSGGGGTSSSKPSSSLSFLTLPLASSSSSANYSAAFPRSLPSFRLQAQPPAMSELDTAAFEADRLRLDAEARLNMMQVAAAAEDGAASEGEGGSTIDAKKKSSDMAGSTEDEEEADAWKWRIRKRIWDLMERENIAVHPRPVHHRIPNFVGAATAAAKLASLPAFQSAKCVKVNPDTPQKQVRYLTLEGNKKLLTPQPRLRSGFFSELEASSLPPNAMVEACTAIGVAKYGKPLGLDAKLKVDLIVIGSVAVNPKTGARLGKGEGFAELEYAMLRHMGAIDDSTLVVTSVHDKQLVEDIPSEKLKVHDVPVDVICTPTHIIHTKTTIPKPKGIYWELLSPEKLGQILVLRQLKKKIEKETGQKLPQGPSEKLPPTAQRGPRKGTAASEKVWRAARKQPVVASSEKGTSKVEQEPIKKQLAASSEKGTGTSKVEQGPKRLQQPVASEKGTTSTEEPVASENGGSNNEPCIFVWNLDITTTWKELKEHVSNAGAEVVKVNIIRKGNNRPMARVLLKDGANIEGLVKALDSSQLGGSTMRAKISSVRERASQVGELSNGAKADTVAEKDAVAEKVPEKATS